MRGGRHSGKALVIGRKTMKPIYDFRFGRLQIAIVRCHAHVQHEQA